MTEKVEGHAASLARAFSDALVHGEGMNDLLHRFLEAIARTLAAPRVVLYDYDEQADTFDLLYFQGFPDDARPDLTARVARIDPERAKSQREPYVLHEQPPALVVPLYLQDTLEALLLLDGWTGKPAEPQADAEALRLVSRFLGLFMSSSRLPANQRADARASADLERAREVQVSYLPREFAATDRYEIYGHNQSAALVGGDYFDYFCRGPESLQFVVADACGHGLSAALTMCTFRGMLHATVAHSERLDRLFDTLNQGLYAGADHLQYLTGIYCSYEQAEGRMHYFNAGHFAPLLVRANGSVEHLPGRGRPLGMFSESTYEMQSCAIGPGDLLVLYTDGLCELENAHEEHFGVEGILASVIGHRRLPLRELAAKVLAGGASFSHSAAPDDDLTLFLVRFLEDRREQASAGSMQGGNAVPGRRVR